MAATQINVLAFTDRVVLQTSEVLDLLKGIDIERFEQSNHQIITQASSLGELPLGSSSINVAVAISSSPEFPSDGLLKEILRVLKPDGTVIVQKESSSAIERQLLLAGYLDAQDLQIKSTAISGNVSVVKARKPSWKIGSSFSLKKPSKSVPTIQLNDDDDLIDEDSLLTEEDLKKPQLPVGDCEIGSTRKACKNCSCGRAEEEEKVAKLGLTMDQLDNPQSACGSCGLGDAFRCGTCPYKGLPPFKMGEKVALPGNFLADDF